MQLEESVAAFDARIEATLAPSRDTVERLKEVPGLGTTAAEVVIAEIGTDMGPFPTAGHLLSWAGLVPRLDESAGKRRSTRVKKGAPWLKPVLVQAAWGAARKKNCYFQAHASKHATGPRKQRSQLPRRSSRPSITCCAMVLATRTSALNISLDATPPKSLPPLPNLPTEFVISAIMLK
jgi:transposase